MVKHWDFARLPLGGMPNSNSTGHLRLSQKSYRWNMFRSSVSWRSGGPFQEGHGTVWHETSFAKEGRVLYRNKAGEFLISHKEEMPTSLYWWKLEDTSVFCRQSFPHFTQLFLTQVWSWCSNVSFSWCHVLQRCTWSTRISLHPNRQCQSQWKMYVFTNAIWPMSVEEW